MASFEEPVEKISGDYGYIDLFWPGIVFVEHKSAGRDLGKAESLAFRYIQDLSRERRTKEIPRYIISLGFNRVALHDLEPEDQRGLPLFDNRCVATTQFPLAEIHKYVHAFIPGLFPRQIKTASGPFVGKVAVARYLEMNGVNTPWQTPARASYSSL